MNIQEASHQIYTYLERIDNLVRAQERLLCNQYDLQPIQLRMLYYLSICNRYSNTPASVTDYVQLTKGTVSQSLKALENKGYIEKQADARDKRQIHLSITESGQTLLAQLPPALLQEVSKILGEAAAQEAVAVLHRLLATMQRTNEMSSFGVCGTCQYHQQLDAQQFRCGLTEELLSMPEAKFICREHTQ